MKHSEQRGNLRQPCGSGRREGSEQDERRRKLSQLAERLISCVATRLPLAGRRVRMAQQAMNVVSAQSRSP